MFFRPHYPSFPGQTTRDLFSPDVDLAVSQFLKKEQFLVGQGFQLKVLMREMSQLLAGMITLDVSLAFVKITMFIQYCEYFLFVYCWSGKILCRKLSDLWKLHGFIMPYTVDIYCMWAFL